jgi:sugar phosphate isomerase/epimerase
MRKKVLKSDDVYRPWWTFTGDQIMQKIKGPGIFLAQFLREEPPFDNLKNISQWAADLGFKGVQIPTWDARVINLDLAATSQTYCDDLTGSLQETGLEVSELAAHLQGQMLVVHPAYAVGFQGFHPAGQSDTERTAWAEDQLKKQFWPRRKCS